MALSNFLEEMTPSAEIVVPENSQSLGNNQAAENVQASSEDLRIVGENSGNGTFVGKCSEEVLPVWWKVLDFIRERMAKELFDIHILPLYPYSFGNGQLIIAAPNEYIYKEVKTKYAPRLLEIIREYFGAEVNADYLKDSSRTEEMVARYYEHVNKK